MTSSNTTPTITVHPVPTGEPFGAPVVPVADNGPGLPPEPPDLGFDLKGQTIETAYAWFNLRLPPENAMAYGFFVEDGKTVLSYAQIGVDDEKLFSDLVTQWEALTF